MLTPANNLIPVYLLTSSNFLYLFVHVSVLKYTKVTNFDLSYTQKFLSLSLPTSKAVCTEKSARFYDILNLALLFGL